MNEAKQVAQSQVIVINVFAAFLPRHAVFLEFTCLARRNLLRLLHVNLVPHGVKLVFFHSVLLVNPRARALTFDPIMA